MTLSFCANNLKCGQIGQIKLLFLEAGAVCPFENSVCRVISTMENFGYRLVDITDLNLSPKRGVLWLTELAFRRASSPHFRRSPLTNSGNATILPWLGFLERFLEVSTHYPSIVRKRDVRLQQVWMPYFFPFKAVVTPVP